MNNHEPLRIIFVGDMNVYARGFSKSKMLQELGCLMTRISHTRIEDTNLDYVPFSFFGKMAWKLGFHIDDQHVNRQILHAVQLNKPDILWIEKGNMIYPSTLKKIKKIAPKICLVSSSDDDMFAWHNRTWSYTFSLKYYDIVFTTKSYNCNADELPSLGAKNVVMVDKAYNPEVYFPIQLSKKEIQYYGADVSFIGSYERERAESILFLAKNGVHIRIWGNGWKSLAGQHQNIQIEGRPIFNKTDNLEGTKAICASKINLCFLRKMNRDLHTSRSVEIPACGAFMLAERTNEHLRLFEENKEIVCFEDNDELLRKVTYYLIHDEERKKIGMAARSRCLHDDYSYKGRLGFMIQKIQELIK